MSDRKSLVESLVRFTYPIELGQIMRDLKKFGWDSKEELVTLTRGDIISVLERFTRAQLTARDIENWANAIEARDDIRFGQNDVSVSAVIFKLATPELEGPITMRRAQALIKVLSSGTAPAIEDVDAAYE